MLLGGTCCSRALDQGSVGRGMLGWEEGGFVGRGDCFERVSLSGACVYVIVTFFERRRA